MEKLFIILLFSLLGVSLSAQSFPTLDDQVASGRKGLYISMGGGIKNTKLSLFDEDFGKEVFKGVGPLFDIKVGGSVSPHWVIHLMYLKHRLASAKTEQGAYEYVTNDDFVIDENAIGIGATYYTNNDFFFSLSRSLSFIYLKNDYLGKLDASSAFYQLRFGKEWWISNSLAINAAGTIYPHMYKFKIHRFFYGVLIGLTFHKKQQM